MGPGAIEVKLIAALKEKARKRGISDQQMEWMLQKIKKGRLTAVAEQVAQQTETIQLLLIDGAADEVLAILKPDYTEPGN